MAKMPPLEGFHFIYEQVVAWGDMDAFGHVNNVVYLRYFESARVQYFFELGYMPDTMVKSIGPIIASLVCNYRQPVIFPDKLLIGVRCLPPKTTSFMMEFVMVSTSQPDTLVADGHAVIVNYNYEQNTKWPVDEELRRRVDKMEGRSEG